MKSKYLEQLGSNPEICDWLKEGDPRYEEEKAYEREYGVFPPANWAFDVYFARWLYCYLKDYLKDASKAVDLNYHKFDFRGKSYTQEEAIKTILESLRKVIVEKELMEDWTTEREIIKEYQESIHLFAEILPSIWW